MFNKKDFLVFRQAEIEKPKEENLPQHLLDYSHQTWTGYVRSNSEKQPDTFAEFVKDICRG